MSKTKADDSMSRSPLLKLMILFYAFIYVASLWLILVSPGVFHWFSLISQVALLALFTAIVFLDDRWGLYLFLVTGILFGFSGSFHRIGGVLPLSAIYLLLLIVIPLMSSQRRLLFKQRVLASRISVFVLISGFVVPIAWFLVGLVRGNEPAYILNDADGWIFYLFFFCLLLCIRGITDRLQTLQVFFWSVTLLGGLLSLSGILLWSGILKPEVLSHLLYEVLGHGGHIELRGSFPARLYTGSGTFLVLVFGYCLALLFAERERKSRKMVWIAGLLLTACAILLSFTRSYWLAAIFTFLSVFLIMGPRQRRRVLLSGGPLLVAAALLLTIFFPRWYQPLYRGLGQIYKSVRYFSRIEHMFAGSPGGGVLESLDGGLNWSSRNRGLPNYHVRAFDISRQDLNIMYVALEGDLVFKSNDRGRSWSALEKGRENSRLIRMMAQFEHKTIYIGEFDGRLFTIHGRSISLKMKQCRALFRHGLTKPFLGNGFGATLPGSITYRSGSDTQPHIFEAGYADLFMKLGLAGTMLWLLLIIRLSGCFIRIVVFQKDNSPDLSHIKALLVSFPGLLVIFGSNPYLYSPYGILPLVLIAFFCDRPVYKDQPVRINDPKHDKVRTVEK